MPFNNTIGRSASEALVPEQVVNDMLGHLTTGGSATLSMFRRVPVTSGQTRFPILSSLPLAYWVNGDTGLAQTTEQKWSNKFLNVEELAVVVPIPQAILEDVGDAGNFDLWSEVQPDVETEIGRVLDQAVFFGVNAPGTFPTDIAHEAEGRPSAGFGNGEADTIDGLNYTGFHSYVEQAVATGGGIQDDIDNCTGLLEPDGFDATGIVANRTLKSKLRRARSSIGERLTGVNPAITEYLDLGITYPMRGLWPSGANRIEAFVGDFMGEFVVGIRRDISFRMLDQSVIQDNTGAIVYNLAQQRMVAMEFTFRAGWQVSNRIRYDQTDESKRYPVATLVSPN